MMKNKINKAPKGCLILLEPPYWFLLENPFHKSSRSTKSGCCGGRLRVRQPRCQVSKLPIWVDKKIAEYVPLYSPSFNLRSDMRNISVILGDVKNPGKAPAKGLLCSVERLGEG